MMNDEKKVFGETFGDDNIQNVDFENINNNYEGFNNSQMGYQGQQGGYQNPQMGYQGQQVGYQNQQMGYQGQQGGCQNQQMGYQGQQGGYQNPQMSYQGQQGEYQNQQMGYQGQQYGYQNPQTMPFQGQGMMEQNNMQTQEQVDFANISEYKQRLRGMKEVQDLTNEVEIQNPNSIIMFGQNASENISKVSDELLNSMKAVKSEEASEMLINLTKIMDKFDVKELKDNEKPSVLSKFIKGMILWGMK